MCKKFGCYSDPLARSNQSVFILIESPPLSLSRSADCKYFNTPNDDQISDVYGSTDDDVASVEFIFTPTQKD